MKHRIACLTLITVLVTLMSACNPGAPKAEKHVYFISAVPVEHYLNAFEAEHPDILVHVYYNLVASNDWPKHFDVALLPFKPYDSHLLKDLAPFVEDDRHFDRSEFWPGVLAAGYDGRRLIVVPIDFDVRVLLFAPSQFRQAGVPLPSPDSTWEDLLRASTAIGKFKQEHNGGYVFLRDTGKVTILNNILFRHVKPYRLQAGRYMPALDDATVVDYLQRIASSLPYLTSPTTPIYKDTSFHLLENGTVAEAIVFSSALRKYSTALRRHPDLAYTALPQPDYAGGDISIHTCLAMSRGTSVPQAAWQWLSFLSRQLAPSPGSLPARKLISNSPPFPPTPLDRDRSFSDAVKSILQGEQSLASTGDFDVLRIIYGNVGVALSMSTARTTSVKAAAAEAQKYTQKELADWYAAQEQISSPFEVVPYLTPEEISRRKNVLRVSIMPPMMNMTRFRGAIQPFLAEHPGWDVQYWQQLRQSDAFSLYFKSWLFLPSPDFPGIGDVNEIAPTLHEGDFLPDAVRNFRWHDHLPGIPVSIRPLILAYDAKTLLNLKEPLPDSSWTVAHMLDVAETVKSKDPLQGAYIPHDGWEVAFLLDQLGVDLFSPDLRPQFTSQPVLTALERIRRLGQSDHFCDNVAKRVFDLQLTNETHFTSLEFVALIPRRGTNWPLSVGFTAVSPGSRHLRVARQWALYTVQHPEIVGDALPALKSLATSDATRTRLGPARYDAYMTMLKRIPAEPITDRDILQGAALWWFDRALRQVGPETDLRDVLEPAQAKAQAFLTCTGGRVKDVAQLAACARKVDPEHPLAQTAP